MTFASQVEEQAGEPSWDDQIVPALRKRLESESAYLSNRLSSSQLIDTIPVQSSSNLPHTSRESQSPSYSPVFPIAGPSTPTSIPVSTNRSRTKSSPLSPPLGPTRRPSDEGRKGQTSMISAKSTTNRNPSGPVIAPSDENGLPRSRIPTRPRSKSQLNRDRPNFVQTNSNSGDSYPPIPSSSNHLPSPTTNARRGSSSPTRPDFSRRASWIDRNSPDLTRVNITEGFIRNELPPFKMFPDEAMRIAERGHDIGVYGDEVFLGDEGMYEDEIGDNRKGSVTTRMASGLKVSRKESRSSVDFDTEPYLPPIPSSSATGISGLPRSVTAGFSFGIGQGHPSSSLRKTALDNNPQNRSSSSRSPNPTGSSSQTPRSASLNMLASQSNTPISGSGSRLGIAAHLVPPENSYTPPKGANWDEVVIPTVAKKMGMGEIDRLVYGEDEGDLAVEWDKDGTPVKWVKRNIEKLDISQRSTISALSVGNQPTNDRTPSKSAFTPTFDISPNNPLRAPSIRQKNSSEHFELAPLAIRTSSAQSTNLAVSQQSHLYSPSTSPQYEQTRQPISRQPSSLSQRQGLTPQPSHGSLRSVAAAQLRASQPGSTFSSNGNLRSEYGAHSRTNSGMVGHPGYFENPRPAPVQSRSSHAPSQSQSLSQPQRLGRAQGMTAGPIQGRDGRGGSTMPPSGSVMTEPGYKGKKGDDVGKGCGCVIM